METHPIAVVGIGTNIYSDQGLGLEIIRLLEQENLPKYVECIAAGLAGLNLIPWMDERKKVIFVGALRMGSPPGSIKRLRTSDLEDIVKSKNYDDDDEVTDPLEFDNTTVVCEEMPPGQDRELLNAIQMAEHLGISPKVIIIAVEPVSVKKGEELTEPIRKKLPSIIAQIKLEIETA